MPFDLSLLPLYRSQDEIRARAPGIVLFEPPRRAERVRSAERLLCYLTYQGDAAPDAETERLLQQLQTTYYATAGSTTAALRTAALHLNRLLLDRNFALRSQKRQGFGLLVLMALRPEQAIWLQGGATHLFLWEQGNLRHVHDPASAGLGYAQSPSFRYGQLNFQAGQRVLICGVLPPGWQSFSLSGSLPSLYRHLMVLERGEVHALLMGIDQGAGTVTWLPLPSLSMAAGSPSAPSGEGPGATAPSPDEAAGGASPRAHYIGGASPSSSTPAQTEGEAAGFSSAPSSFRKPDAQPPAPPAAAPAGPASGESRPAAPSTPAVGQPATAAPAGPASGESRPAATSTPAVGQPATAAPAGPASGESRPAATSALGVGQSATAAPAAPASGESRPAAPSIPAVGQPATAAPAGPASGESRPAAPSTPVHGRPASSAESAVGLTEGSGALQAEASSPGAEEVEAMLAEEAAPAAGSASAYTLPQAAASASGSAVRPESVTEGARQAASPVESSQVGTHASPRTRPPSSPFLKSFARALLRLLEGLRQTRQKSLEALGRFLPRLLPASETPLPVRTQGLLLLLAIVIPLLVVTAAVATYFRLGSNLEYEMYLNQAQALRAQALSATDAVTRRDAWQGVLFYAEKAESYRRTSEAQALRQEAERELAQLLGVVSLKFQPALSAPLSLPISRLVSAQGDLYLLDAQNGRVLRALNDRGRLRLDEGFQCAPGTYGSQTVGALVDLLPLPDFNFYGATVLATDASGMLLYCAPDAPPQAVALPRPNANWTRLTAFALDGDTLYVLDAASRAIWEYTGYQGKFERPPRFIFPREVPPIENGIDLVALQDTLYVLHATGMLTTCVNGRLEGVPTRCQTPAALHDPYPAHQGLAEFQQVHLAQVMLGAPPAMPLLFLDDEHRAIYRFSSRSLELQEVWKAAPLSLPDLRWTAFTVSAENVLYLALEDRIYFANLP
jgi:hypothetical protein